MTNKANSVVVHPQLPERRFDVVFVLPHMGRGGAQRVTSLVANAWSRNGKRICILTWDAGRKDAHAIVPDVVRVDLTELCRDIESRLGMHRRLWRYFLNQTREFERWLRPRWPWRKIKKTSVVDGQSGDENGERRSLWPSRWYRRAAAAILAAIEQSGSRTTPSRHEKYIRRGLIRFLLGNRVGMFRMALAELDTPVVVSLLTSTNFYVLGAGRDGIGRVIVSERNDPDLQQIAPEWQALRRSLYRRADAVTSNSAGVLEKLSSFVPVEKLKLLPNPVVVTEISEEGAHRERRFVTVARLVHQKGVDLLLAAFAKIAQEVPGWTLHIAGDGPLHPNLTAQAERLGIADRVTFYGHAKNPIALLQSCRVFVLPSRFEGMPNALLEAMACGLAPIVTDASPGPLECVRPDQTGLVVESENVSAIAAAMLRLARDDQLTARLGRQAVVFMKEHDWTVVESQWLAVVDAAVSDSTSPAQ